MLLMGLLLGWMKAVTRKPISSSTNIFISVVIAMRNERQTLHQLFQSLSILNYPSTDFEIIIVDDHSDDESILEAKKWIDHFSSLTVLAIPDSQNGKKAALTYGISKSKGRLIATTDADCVLPVNWLQEINEAFQNENTNMVIGAVALQDENKFFSQLQSIEFASVIGTGMALCELGKPIMCNGANLSFRKRVFEEVKGYEGNEHILSGDDEFLMRKIQVSYPSSIHTLNPEDCLVVTKPQASVKDFFQQRIRWASKWKVNSSVLARLIAVFMFVFQVSWLMVIVWSVGDKFMIGVAVIFLKFIFDFIFLRAVCQSLKMKFNLWAFLCLQFLYPLYVLYVGFFSQVKNHQWKGRVGTS